MSALSRPITTTSGLLMFFSSPSAIRGPGRSGGVRRFGRRRDDREVQRRSRTHAITLGRCEQQGRGFAADHVRALAHLAKAVDVRGAAEPDGGRLFVATFTGELLAGLASDR